MDWGIVERNQCQSRKWNRSIPFVIFSGGQWYGSVAQRKAKKTWGERLRLPALPKLRERWKDRDGPGNPARMAINYGTKPPGSTYGTVTSQSALAKSMEYAEPWLYATYGRSAGAPPNPVRDLARTAPVVQAWDPKPRLPMPKAGVPEAVYEEIAGPGFDLDEFICACRAKLSASQRSRTKFVKDCKSARRSTTTGRNKTKGRSRPSLNSVLSSTEDPYSFMRKARLLTGTSNSSSESFHRPATLVEVEESSYQEFPDYISAKKNRFATVHSIRSGTKTRGPLPVDFAPPVSISSSEPAFTLDNTDDSRDSAYSRGAVGGKEPDTASQWDNSSFEEEFFDASDRISNNGLASPPRKSILECNVNAYDLMMRLGRSDFLGYDSGSDELSDNALQLEARSMPAKRIPKFTDYNKNEVLGGIRLRNGPPSYQLLSDGEGEEASSSSECTVNTSNNSSLYGIGTMSSNNSSTMLDESVDYVKMPNDDGVFKAPVPPPLPDRYPVKMSGEPLMAGSIPPPPPLPPPPPPMPLAQHGRDNSLNESDSSSTSGISDDSDAPKRPPRQKRDQPVVKRVSSCDSVSNTLVNPQDAVINQLKSILKKPPLQPVERSSVSVSRKHSVAEEPKEPAQLGRHLARRSESVDELETPSHDKQRKKKQVQFRSSADITVLSRDSMSDDFSEELESELESIFKRMKLSSRWGTQVATTAAVSAAGDEMDPAREEQDDAAAAAADADTEPGSPPGAEFNPCDEQHPALPEAVAVLEASASTSVIVAVSDSVVSGKVGVTSSTSSQRSRCERGCLSFMKAPTRTEVEESVRVTWQLSASLDEKLSPLFFFSPTGDTAELEPAFVPAFGRNSS
ncbi:unnamed protein product [Notodromas monacha]|uniref:Uncharacterized protein n=1 Tax=Notodromas monacha TaxID=399045 RepID=A0A7R9BCE3_9CRUS|nr:unnamed protein product [Notodromas monacha]CAG0912654.1 unnamed protein product [Notodromas monacha]